MSVFRFKDFLVEAKDKENWDIKKVIDKFNINLSFVSEHDKDIEQLIPIVNTFVSNLNLKVDVNEEQIICLTICALAILLEEPKDNYRNLFEPIRLSGLYSLISSDPSVKTQNMDTERKTPLLNLFDFIKAVFKIVSGDAVSDIKEMMNHSLFDAFIKSLSTVIKNKDLSPLSNIAKDGMDDAISVGFSLASVSFEDFVKEVIAGIRNVKPNANVKDVKINNKVEPINDGEIVKFDDFEVQEHVSVRTQKDIDKILDKILQYGEEFLSDDEREFLSEFTNNDNAKLKESPKYVEVDGLIFMEHSREDHHDYLRINGTIVYDDYSYDGYFLLDDGILITAQFDSEEKGTSLYDEMNPNDAWEKLDEIAEQL